LTGKEGTEAFVRQLNSDAFDVWMREEIAALERCFAALPDGRLVWMPPPVKKRLRLRQKQPDWDCEVY
jgi:hypothetical protein